MTRRKLRLTLTREELVDYIWAMDAIIDDYQHDGGTCLIEREIKLRDKLNGWLREYDLEGKRAVSP